MYISFLYELLDVEQVAYHHWWNASREKSKEGLTIVVGCWKYYWADSGCHTEQSVKNVFNTMLVYSVVPFKDI